MKKNKNEKKADESLIRSETTCVIDETEDGIKDKEKTGRRKFLKMIGLGGLAASALGILGISGSKEVLAAVPLKKS